VRAGETPPSAIGREVSVPEHLQDGDEFKLPVRKLIKLGAALFSAIWTAEEGGGRPLTKGTGAPLADPAHPLVFPQNFNRVSAPDANSCAGCHNAPFGIPGGGGDIVGNVFVLGQRFDFATFDETDVIPTRNSVDERGIPVTLQNIANSRATLGMFGSGYIEMLARQITEDLQRIRDTTLPGQSNPLTSKGISFGTIARHADGTWDVSSVDGLPATSLTTSGATPPSLIIRPFHQAGRVVSLREFTNNAFNHHHGIQSVERFGLNTDPDGDGFANEMTRAEVTAASVFQATMAVPGRVIPNDPAIEAAVRQGEQLFVQINCTECHIPSLPLDREGWMYSEPNPYNPAGNLRPGEAPALVVDLSSSVLPMPRLRPNKKGVVRVPAFTDFKLHDITNGPGDPNAEPLDMQQPQGSPGFFAGNRKFITRKLWGVANEPPYFHHGLYTTMRQAVLAHSGEALAQRQSFQALTPAQQDAVIEFLKTLRVLRPGTPSTVVDENYHAKNWVSDL
jgi:hypothetical protein